MTVAKVSGPRVKYPAKIAFHPTPEKTLMMNLRKLAVFVRCAV